MKRALIPAHKIISSVSVYVHYTTGTGILLNQTPPILIFSAQIRPVLHNGTKCIAL